MSPYLIAPSIIASDFTKLGDEIAACESAGADWIHMDIMDGHFVPTITVGPLFVEACRRATKLPLDVHLMVTNPDQQLEGFAKAGADRLTVHVETCPDLPQTIEKIKSLGCKRGRDLESAHPRLRVGFGFALVDLVLVMSVTPGFSGQKFMPEMIGKVEEIRNKLNALRSHAFLEVDGGISAGNAPPDVQSRGECFCFGKRRLQTSEGRGEGNTGCCASAPALNKNHGASRDLWCDGKTNLCRRFAECLDALGASVFLTSRPFSMILTFCRFGLNVRLVARRENERLCPKVVALPQELHLAILEDPFQLQ